MKKLPQFFTKITNYKHFIFFFLCFLIILIPISNVVRALFLNINANDFSIYQQAIYDISLNNLNPYLTIKGTGIFNDHADPIIFLAVWWCKIFGYSAYALLFFEWIWFVFLIVATFFLLKKEGKITKVYDPIFLFSISLIIFSRSILQGLEFPIHPTTWSMLPLFFLFYFVNKNKFIPIVLFSLIICWYREVFPLMLMCFSFYFLLNKRPKQFLIIFLIGASHYYLLSHLRPLLLGPTVDYGDTLLKQLLHQHIFFIWERFKSFSFPAKVFIPYLLLSLLFFKYEIKINSLKSLKSFIAHPLCAVILFVWPMFFLHALANYLVHHHSVPMVIPFIAIIIFSTLPERILKNKFLLYLTLIILISLSSSRYTKMVKNVLLLDKDANYSYSEANDKLTALKELKTKLENLNQSINHEAKIMASGGVIASILKPNMKLYQFCEVTDNNLIFDYLILEKRSHGDLNPLTIKDILQIESDCIKYKTETILDNQFFVVMKGAFDDRCLGMKKRWSTPSTVIPSTSSITSTSVEKDK
ncbi:MAG: DUF2079 domain-containing protein [Oligoflexia bacterium]|nr:DUF2079 domain-containing protein [Oligoflexia bacterium]